MWDKALGYLRQAGNQAVARSANREAVTCFDQALAVLPHLPESHTKLELAIDLYLELCVPLQASGRFARAAQCAREAEGLARRLGDSHRVARASAYVCHHCRMVGHMAEADNARGRRVLPTGDGLG
jgi:hypothetical protein